MALLWTFATGELTAGNFFLGYGISFAVLIVTQRLLGSSHYGRQVWLAARLAVTFFWELIVATLQVAYDVVTPRHHMRPGILAIPLEVKGDLPVTLLANLLTLTPGSLSLEVDENKRILYVHVMYIDDVEKTRRRIKETFERQIRAVFADENAP